MYRRFNNGVGYVVAIPADRTDQALSVLRRHFPSEQIGTVSKGSGRVSIESQYDSSTVVF